MPHQNVHTSKATARKGATDEQTGREGGRRDETRSYAEAELTNTSLAAPAAGEMADYMDEGEALGADDVQQGANHTNRHVRHEPRTIQGRKTIEGNRQRLKTGSADGN
jgi:hypothetical protein